VWNKNVQNRWRKLQSSRKGKDCKQETSKKGYEDKSKEQKEIAALHFAFAKSKSIRSFSSIFRKLLVHDKCP